MTNYSSLTTDQQSQAAYLFADDVFGTDPNAFDYELQDGNITGRSYADKSDCTTRLKVRKPHKISVNVTVREVPRELVTVEMERNTAYVIQDLARAIIARSMSGNR